MANQLLLFLTNNKIRNSSRKLKFPPFPYRLSLKVPNPPAGSLNVAAKDNFTKTYVLNAAGSE